MKNAFLKLKNFANNKFKISENGSTFKRESVGGVVNFLVVAYVMIVIPNILAGNGLQSQEVWNGLFLATILAVIFTTFALAFGANMPLVSAPGIGLSSYFATLISGGNFTFAQTLTIALVAGVLFVILTLVGFRQKLVNALPSILKTAIPAGIGLFILNIGLNDSNGGILSFFTNGPMFMVGNQAVWISAIVAIFGFVAILVLSHYKVKGAIFYSIIGATVLHFIIMFFTGVNPFESLVNANWLPQFNQMFDNTFFKFDFKGAFLGDGTNVFGSIVSASIIVFSYILVDLFDTVGTLFGVAKGTPLINQTGQIKNSNKVFWVDSVSTVYGAMLGVPGCTVYVESSAGIRSGARTGFSAMITALLFVLALFLSPIFMLIPASATAPALIYIGVSMFSSVQDIDFSNIINSVPAIFTIIVMPFTNNIAYGIGVGLILYTILMFFAKKGKELNVITITLSVIFILFFATQNLF